MQESRDSLNLATQVTEEIMNARASVDVLTKIHTITSVSRPHSNSHCTGASLFVAFVSMINDKTSCHLPPLYFLIQSDSTGLIGAAQM